MRRSSLPRLLLSTLLLVARPAACGEEETTPPLLDVAESADLGVYLVNEAGMALYTCVQGRVWLVPHILQRRWLQRGEEH